MIDGHGDPNVSPQFQAAVRGPEPPFTPGGDVVGELEAVGPAVTGVREGDRVTVLTS